MQRNPSIHTTLLDIFRILSEQSSIKLYHDNTASIQLGSRSLITLNSQSLLTPLSQKDILTSFLGSRMNDPDNTEYLTQFSRLISQISPHLLRLNHIGFEYFAESRDEELSRIKTAIQKSEVFLYEEHSNDPNSAWFFVGDTARWQDPLIEIVPVFRKKGTWAKYWLPQIHLDIDTDLTPEEIFAHIAKQYQGTSVKSFEAVKIEGIVYVVGIWIATSEGINVYLNLATKHRNVPYHRSTMLQKL